MELIKVYHKDIRLWKRIFILAKASKSDTIAEVGQHTVLVVNIQWAATPAIRLVKVHTNFMVQVMVKMFSSLNTR